MPATPSRFVWYELMTSDLAAAETFYKKVVGWESERWQGNDFPYIIVKVAGEEAGVGGLMSIPAEAAAAGMRPTWVGYIYAPDVDKATASLANAGGRVFRQPADIPDVGRFSVVADPQGAMFNLMTPNGPDQPPPPMTPGHVGWRELHAADGQAALDFYSSQFGWTKTDAMDMGPMGTYLLFATGGTEAVGGMMTKTADMPHPAWVYYFSVEEIDAAAGRVTENKGKVVNGPMEVPGGIFIVQCTDPQGALFALLGPRG